MGQAIALPRDCTGRKLRQLANRAEDAAPGAMAYGNRDRRSRLLRVEHAIGQRFGINLRADLLVAVWFLPS
jgi:hypothetical protein